MAQFKIAYNLTKKSEGGYADVAGDNGGVTYAGITFKNYPHWKGWGTVFSKKRSHNEHIPELDALVEEFYKKEFWDNIEGDKIMDQEFANDLYDQSVNSGIKAAIKIAQSSVGRKETGVFTPQDINAINGIA